MEKLDTESETKFINALVKSVQSLCHGYLDFHSGVEIIGHINLSVDKGSSLHYILEEKVCKNEENSTLFISNSFHAQNQKHEGQPTTEDSQKEPSENQDIDKTDYKVLIKAGNASSSVSTYSPTLSGRNETSETESSSGTKEPDSVPSRSVSTVSGCPKRKAPGDQTNARNTKSSRVCSLPCPVSRISSRCPREPAESDVLGRVDLKQSQSEVHPPCENVTGTVVPQGTGAAENTESSLDISLAGSVLERVDSQDSPDLNSRTDDSDGDGEVMFIKQEFVEGESPLCQFQGTGGEQSYGRGEHQTQGASSSDALSDASPYSVSLQHPAAATYVPGSHEEDASTTSAAAQLYGPSTLSLSQPGSSVSRGTGGQQGAAHQFRHSNHLGFMVGDTTFHPPLAHHAHRSISHHALELSVLDLSIKTEPSEPDFVLFNCEQRRKKNSVCIHSNAGSRSEEARQKAKEKSKEYRLKQKIHRMRDSTYDMIFRHQVAERKRRQRMRERIKGLKHHNVTGYSIAQ